MTEWKEYKLGEIGTVITGKTPSARNPEDWGDNMLFITPSDYRNYRKYATNSERKLSKVGIDRFEKKILPANSILVTCIGSDMGKVVMNRELCITNQQINAIVPNTSVNNDFLYYRLISIYDTLRILGGDGTAVPIVNKSDFENIRIELPPLPEQIRIASILSSLDDKIDLLHRENKTLEAMAETLFRQWFIEEAKEDWEEGKLGDILSVKGGTTPSTKEPSFWDGDIAWTSPRDVTTLNGLYLFETEKRITQRGLEQISSGLLPSGTLLMSSRAPVGVLAFAEIPLAINQGYIAILDDKGYSKEFIYLWLKTNMDLVHSYSNGSTFMEISKSAFKSLDISIPSKNEVECFVQEVKPYFDKIRTNEIQIRTLTKTRDGLLPKLMSNEINI